MGKFHMHLSKTDNRVLQLTMIVKVGRNVRNVLEDPEKI